MPPVYVLIGGKSRRFGVDKASHPIDGAPWALDVGRRLSAGDATLVGPAPPSGPLADARFVPDAVAAIGPLGGALAAIEDRRERLGEGLLVLASCDLVRPDRRWLLPLVAEHDAGREIDLAAYQADGRWQPFPSVVHTRWAPGLRETIESGEASFQSAFQSARAAAVAWTGAAGGPPQANTPEELRGHTD